MKTLIVGTGVIGVIYGWALSEASVDVTHHAASNGSLQETKVTYASMMKTAAQLGFDIPHTRALGVYLQNV